MMAGVDLVHVPYRGGGPALTDLLGGQVQVQFPTTVASIEYIRAGRLRALAVTAATRSEALPDIPTVAEFVPGFEASNWFGFCAPNATPAEIIDTLNKEINAALADPNMKARLADLGGTVLAASPADFGKLIADETEKCAGARRRHVEFAGIGLGIGDELGNRLGRNRRVHHHDVGTSEDARDRRDVADKIEIELVVKRRVGRVDNTAQEERVSVGRRTYDRLGADIAAATRPVVDHKLLAEPLRQPLTHQARRDVARAARRDWHDQPHRPCRVDLRPRDP